MPWWTPGRRSAPLQQLWGMWMALAAAPRFLWCWARNRPGHGMALSFEKVWGDAKSVTKASASKVMYTSHVCQGLARIARMEPALEARFGSEC